MRCSFPKVISARYGLADYDLAKSGGGARVLVRHGTPLIGKRDDGALVCRVSLYRAAGANPTGAYGPFRREHAFSDGCSGRSGLNRLAVVSAERGIATTDCLAAAVLCNRPLAEVCEELREGGGQVVGIQAAGVGKNPSAAASEKGLLETDSSVFDTRDDAVGLNANKGDDGRTPASDFRLEAPAAGAKLVIGEFIRAGSGAINDVGNAELEVEKKGFLKRGEEARSESAAVQGGPKAISRAAEVSADGGGIEAGVDARKEHDEVFGGEIRYALVTRCEDLGFARLPGSNRCPIHMAASSMASVECDGPIP